jgi:hypothetical protein
MGEKCFLKIKNIQPESIQNYCDYGCEKNTTLFTIGHWKATVL